MTQQNIDPQRINKPIQLLAAWLAGLILINGSFLSAAALVTAPSWASGALVIAAIANVPIFLVAIFVLQTKFRPEMQEDSYYHAYLTNKKGEIIDVQKAIDLATDSNTQQVISEISWSGYKISLNKHHIGNTKIFEAIHHSGATITNYFGSDSHPKDKVVTIGSGFSVDHMRTLLPRLHDSGFYWANYGFDEEESNQYDQEILIGSYGETGAPMKEIIDLIQNEKCSSDLFYRTLCNYTRPE